MEFIKCFIFQICQGGTVPESYYLSELVQTDSMKKINVPPGSKNYVPVSVKLPGSVIRFVPE